MRRERLQDLSENWTRRIAKRLGQRIELLREEEGLSRSQLAERAGVGYNAVRDWEQGVRVPKLPSLLLIAEIFGYHSIEELLGGPFGTSELLALRENDE